MPIKLPPSKLKVQNPNRYLRHKDKDKDKDESKDDEDDNDDSIDEESIKKIRIMKAELTLVILTLARHIHYKEECNEECKKELDMKHIKTHTHEGGEVLNATPFQVCRADCIARGVTHGFGFFGLMVASLYIVKVTYLKKMKNGLLFYAPAWLTTFLSTYNTITCLTTCDKLKK